MILSRIIHRLSKIQTAAFSWIPNQVEDQKLKPRA